MSFMKSQVLGKESPLYGRRTAQFKIMPLDYKDTAVFHPNLSEEDNALIYGITGGVPHYINKLDVRDSVDEALMENLFDRSSYLYEEPANLLKQELREPAIYNAIIKAIAEGASRLNDITTKVGEENTDHRETGQKNDLSSGGQFFSFLVPFCAGQCKCH